MIVYIPIACIEINLNEVNHIHHSDHVLSFTFKNEDFIQVGCSRNLADKWLKTIHESRGIADKVTLDA